MLIQTSPVVAFRPEAGRCDIAERLAGARAGLSQHHIRIALRLPWREGGGSGIGIVGLAGPLLGMRTQDTREPDASLCGSHSMGGGRRRRGSVLPFRQARG